jgi:hypothetical protein
VRAVGLDLVPGPLSGALAAEQRVRPVDADPASPAKLVRALGGAHEGVFAEEALPADRFSVEDVVDRQSLLERNVLPVER